MSELIDRQEAIDRFNVIRPADKKKDEYTKGIDVGIAMCIVAVKDQPTIQPVATDTNVGDTISRQAAIDAIEKMNIPEDMCVFEILSHIEVEIATLPTAQPELTDEQAITHLQSSGWMQRHDKEMYESGLKEYLADDSDSYDSLLPSAQPEPKEGHWIPVTNGRGGHECDRCHEYAPSYQSGNEHLSKYCPNCGAKMTKHQSIYHRSTYHYPHGTGLCGQYGSRNGQVRKERFRDQLRASLRPRSCGVSYVTDHQD